LQQAPDYRKDQDIVVVAPDGTFASFCLIWFDEPNQLASLEPVGTLPEYRRMGLAREAIYEAIRRVSAKGAERVIVGSSMQFYQDIGFVPQETLIRFVKFYH
jgi:predicted N-acetyltransferase YhbS